MRRGATTARDSVLNDYLRLSRRMRVASAWRTLAATRFASLASSSRGESFRRVCSVAHLGRLIQMFCCFPFCRQTILAGVLPNVDFCGTVVKTVSLLRHSPGVPAVMISCALRRVCYGC